MCVQRTSTCIPSAGRRLRGAALTLACVFAAGTALANPQFTVIHQFTGSAHDGAHPIDGLILDGAGSFFGVTTAGGVRGEPCLLEADGSCGTAFKLTAPSARQPHYAEAPIHLFSGPDGILPSTRLAADKSGALYGMTLGDSADRTHCTDPSGFCGLVYKLTPPAQGHSGWTETVLHHFTNLGAGFAGGYQAFGGMVVDRTGALIGATFKGGSTTNCFDTFAGCGVVFRLTPPAEGGTTWTEQVLYTFGSNGPKDAGQPNGGLIEDPSGAIYGTTMLGGAKGGGTVWKLTPPGQGQSRWTETILHSFSGPDGLFPLGPLTIGSSGAIFGGTSAGGAGAGCASGVDTCGVVFKLTPPSPGQTAWTEAVLHTFGSGSDGASPGFGLIEDQDGNLFGTTGNGPGHSGTLGTVFELSPPKGGSTAWTETLLHTFTGGTDGQTPSGGLIWSNGVLLGTAEAGGAFLGGTLFSIKP